jgi:hypothetical protein
VSTSTDASAAARRPTLAVYAGLLTITLATLMYEIALTRIFSVSMWYHFAFVAISVALFGMTVGALIVYLLPHRFADVERSMWRYALAFAIAVPICLLLQLQIKFRSHWDLASVWSVVSTVVVVSVPFVLSGVVVCLALTSFPLRVNRLYAADLLGAALGAIVVVFAFTKFDGPSLVIGVGAAAAFGALCFATTLRTKAPMIVAGGVALVLGAASIGNAYQSSVNDPIIRIKWAKEHADPKHKFETWNAYSRVTVDGTGDRLRDPSGWGISDAPGCDGQVREMDLTIDSHAATVLTHFDGDLTTTDYLRCDVSNLAHYAKDDADVLVIGVGGGRDILSALEFEQRSVTGVEINSAIVDTVNDTYGDFTGHLDQIPNVDFVNAEARSYLARSDRKFDMIQISLIDTWAATSAGAFALSENGLYTTDAWDMFFDRLEPGGFLSVSRWYSLLGQEPLETFRTVALASEVLTERGVENPRDHIAVFHGPTFGFLPSNVATVVVSPDPITGDALTTLEEEAERLDFEPILTPSVAADERFADLVGPGGPDQAVDDFEVDISPPSDNRPFFFQMAKLENLFGVGYGYNHTTQSTYTLAILAMVVLGLALLCIGVPLFVRARRVSHQGMAPYYGYFAAIGLAFLLVEISQLQRLSIFLGHPTAALTVVLFSMLLFSGIGSMLAEFFVRPGRPGLLLAPLALLLAVLVVFVVVTPWVLDAAEDQATPVRFAVGVLILMPISLLMGMPFSIGMRAATRREGAPTPYLWGINGAMSVCASVFATAIAIFFGIFATFAAGFLAYCAATLALWAANRRDGALPAEVPAEPDAPIAVETDTLQPA